MKKLLGIIVLGLGLTFSVSADEYPLNASVENQYDYTTQFLKDGDYSGAEVAFKKFIEINPNHKLSGYAQYWLAETFRVRQRNTDAALNYLIGYQKYPKSNKAPINLLKLGVTLVQIGEKKQGCKILIGMAGQYPNANVSVKEKAKYEAKKFKCDKQEKNYLAEIPKLMKKFGIEAKKETSQTQKVVKKEKKKSKWITKKTTTEDKTIKSKTNKVLEQEKAKITTDKRDNDAPILIVDENIIVNSSSYSFIVKAEDKGSEKIFIQVDGVTSEFKDGIFKIDRFSPVDEKIILVAIDQWGNKSNAKTVNIKVDIKDTIVAKKIEKLNPSKLKVKKSRNKVALIIGIEDYSQSPNATFANLDAKYFYEYASKGFGVKKENIKLMIDKEATLIKSIGVLSKWLPSRIKSGETDLIIFFAGHGLASNDGKDLFLLSQDSDPDLLARTALSRTELFKEIIKLNPKSVTMFLDTCYSGVSRDEKTLLASARPVRIIADEQDTPDNFTIFSASQLDQISSGLKDAKHGIFSYYLMKGLEGKADLNKDRNITNGELLAYMDENVAQKASELGRQQNPSLSGNEDKILLKY